MVKQRFWLWLVACFLLGMFTAIAWQFATAHELPPAQGNAGASAADERDAAPTPSGPHSDPPPTALPGAASAMLSTPADAVERESTDIISSALLAYATAEANRAWGELRKDVLPAAVLDQLLPYYEHHVRAMPAEFVNRAARQATLAEAKVEAYSKADAVTLLSVLDVDEPDARAFVAGKRFASLFELRGAGPVLDGRLHRSGDKLEAGNVLVFPAGVFELEDLARGNAPFPAEITVRGAGMNATLIRLATTRARSSLDRLTFEDCTLFCEDAICDMRSHPAVLSLRRVRCVGFDCGAGSSVVFYLFGKSALMATDCRFEGGYGRMPGRGNLMDTRSLCLARFERCVFDRIALRDAGRTVQFTQCEMHELTSQAPRDPLYEDCRITVLDVAQLADVDSLRRDLNTLFPQWRERLPR